MKPLNLAGVILIVAGILGLAYGGFYYDRKSHEANLGPIELSVTERKRFNVPVWLGAGAIALGLVLVLVRRNT